MGRRKMAVFDEIHKSHISILRTLLKEGFIIYFMRADKNLLSKSDMQTYLNSGLLVSLTTIDFDHLLSYRAMLHAHKNVDKFFTKYCRDNRLLSDLVKLTNSFRIDSMYRKSILEDLYDTYLIELMANYLNEKNNPDELYLYFLKHRSMHQSDFSLLDKRIHIVNSNSFSTRLAHFSKKMAYVFYPLFIIFKKFKSISNKKRKEYRVGVCIKHPKNIFLMNFFTETVLLDGKELPKEKVLFIDESGNVNIADYKKRKLNYTRVLDDREYFSPSLAKRIIKGFFPTWIKSLSFIFDEWPLVFSSSKILTDYVLWSILSDTYKIENYVKWVMPDHPSKTIMLSQLGITTWFIYPDNYAMDYHSGWDEKIPLNLVYTYMDYDFAVIYGDKVRRYFLAHKNNIGKYILNGILFAQVDLEIASGKLKSPIFSMLEKKQFSNDMKIIGIFDTSYGHIYPFKMKDGLQFAKELLKLLNEREDLAIIFKAKKELATTPKLAPVYDKLKNHERCLFLARYDEHGISAPEVIAVSDLVVTVPFTSTTIEALGAGKRAFYYDVGAHHRGDNYYFNKFPNFVAHDYEEFKKLIDLWLYETDESCFSAFLNDHVRDEIDPYLDGKALSRLRSLLIADVPMAKRD